jgi:replicative DNA helicase
MKMEIRKIDIDLSEERKLLINCIVNTDFLKQIIPILQPNLLRSRYSRKIIIWVKSYFEKYEEAPNKNIEDIFIKEQVDLTEEEAGLIRKLLSSISEESDNHNLPYSLDQAELYLKKQKLLNTSERITDLVNSNNILQAELEVVNYTKLERPNSNTLDITTTDFRNIIDYQNVKLFSYPGDLGELCGPFCRGDFFADFGFAKRGKTWQLLYKALLAFRKNLNVLFYSFEMPEYDLAKRILQMITSSCRNDFDQEIALPVFTSTGEIDYEYIKPKILNLNDINKVQQMFSRHKKARFKFKSFPAFAGTLNDVFAHIDLLEYFEDFYADVIVIDYLDIVAPDRDAPKEYRHFIDYLWKRARGLAQKKNAIVFTGSQTGRSTTSRDVNTGDVAEDIRKLAHITGGISLNQTDEEKKQGIMRIKPMVFREEFFSGYDEVTILQCLKIGQPILDCRRSDKVILPTETKKGREHGLR